MLNNISGYLSFNLGITSIIASKPFQLVKRPT